MVLFGLLLVLAALALCPGFYVYDLATVICATIEADAMGQLQLFALSTEFQRRRLQVIVRAAAIAPALGMLAFR